MTERIQGAAGDHRMPQFPDIRLPRGVTLVAYAAPLSEKELQESREGEHRKELQEPREGEHEKELQEPKKG